MARLWHRQLQPLAGEQIALVAVLVLYHLWCGHMVKQFARGHNRHGHVFYRWFNEFPVLVLIGAVLLVVLKPA